MIIVKSSIWININIYIYIYILVQIAHVGVEIRSPTQVRWIDIV